MRLNVKLLVSKSSISSLLVTILLLVNIVFILLPFSFEEALNRVYDSGNTRLEKYSLLIAIFNTLNFLILIFLNLDKILNIKLISIILIQVFLSISIVLSELDNTRFLLFTIPISFIAVFLVIRHIKTTKTILDLLLIIFILWSSIPVVDILLNPGNINYFSGDGKYWMSTFRGFAVHRNAYGFISGMTILLVILQVKNIYVKLSIIAIISYGIFLSESRSTIFSLIVIVTYFVSSNSNKRNFYLILSFGLSSILVYYLADYYYKSSIRGSTLFSYEDRISLVNEFTEIILNNLFFGLGGPVLSKSGDPVHNFFFQTIASFGIFVAFPYFVLLTQIWKEQNLRFRVLFGYLLLFGLFQPYFQFSAISNYMLILFIVAYLIDNEFKSRNTINNQT